MDKAEHRSKNPLGILRECCANPSVDSNQAYLLLAKIKADYKSPYSVTEVATLVRISALEKTSLRELVTKPRDSVNFNQSVKELTLF